MWRIERKRENDDGQHEKKALEHFALFDVIHEKSLSIEFLFPVSIEAKYRQEQQATNTNGQSPYNLGRVLDRIRYGRYSLFVCCSFIYLFRPLTRYTVYLLYVFLKISSFFSTKHRELTCLHAHSLSERDRAVVSCPALALEPGPSSSRDWQEMLVLVLL